MSRISPSCLATLALIAALAPAFAQSTHGHRIAAATSMGTRPPQFLLISYDATPGPDAQHDAYVSIAAQVRHAARGNGHITLFLNAKFFMLPHGWTPPPGSRWEGHPETWARYVDPMPTVRWVIPYGRDPDEIVARVATVQVLAREGHELASHGMRHLHGRAWSSAAWRAEFDEYERYMHDVVGLPPPRGFRSPFLEWSPTLFESEAERRFAYDASRPVGTPGWPLRAAHGVWEIGVPTLFFPTLQRVILVFDDSFRIRHLTDADVEPVYLAEFERRYRGARAPMVIASHGNYSGPALRLATRVCRRPDVRCATFGELADYMSAHPELAGRTRGALLASSH